MSDSLPRGGATGLQPPDGDALEPLALLGWTAENALGASTEPALPSQAISANMQSISAPPAGRDAVADLLSSPEVDMLPSLPFADMLGILNLDEVKILRDAS